MPVGSTTLILTSVLLGAIAQIAFKYGMTAPSMSAALNTGPLGFVSAIAKSAPILFGLLAYAVSALAWLIALTKVELSFAYPFVALGIVITVVAGLLIFSEPLPIMRILAVSLICIGVILLASSG